VADFIHYLKGKCLVYVHLNKARVYTIGGG